MKLDLAIAHRFEPCKGVVCNHKGVSAIPRSSVQIGVQLQGGASYDLSIQTGNHMFRVCIYSRFGLRKALRKAGKQGEKKNGRAPVAMRAAQRSTEVSQ